MHPTGDVDPAGWRRDYRRAELSEADALDDPIDQLRRWLADASAAGMAEPNAMVLATVDADGRPAARTVLLKGIDAAGLTFFTNLGSRKAAHLDRAPFVALVFPWVEIQRQVEVAGPVVRVPDQVADEYFASRPRESQLGAWASRQSHVLSGRAELDARAAVMIARFEGAPVPRPPFWGGFRVIPDRIEFWQGRPGRLHDRLRYRRDGPDVPWRVERLAP